jgi:hypothetical protein
MQTRQARRELTAYTLDLSKRTIPANAILHDFRAGPGHEGLAEHNPDVVSFHYDGQIFFNVAHEIIGRTVAVNVAWWSAEGCFWMPCCLDTQHTPWLLMATGFRSLLEWNTTFPVVRCTPGEVVAGTRTIHAIGGHRADRGLMEWGLKAVLLGLLRTLTKTKLVLEAWSDPAQRCVQHSEQFLFVFRLVRSS